MALSHRVCLKQSELVLLFILSIKRPLVSLLWLCPIRMSQRKNSWQCECTKLMLTSIVLIRTYSHKHCTCLLPLGYKACWSLRLYLPGVTRAWAEPVYLLCVPVCQWISGKDVISVHMLLSTHPSLKNVQPHRIAISGKRRQHLEMCFCSLEAAQK